MLFRVFCLLTFCYIVFCVGFCLSDNRCLCVGFVLFIVFVCSWCLSCGCLLLLVCRDLLIDVVVCVDCCFMFDT